MQEDTRFAGGKDLPKRRHSTTASRGAVRRPPASLAALATARAIRAAVPPGAAASARLLIVEATSDACGLPPLLQPRLLMDVQMMALFGGGKERGVEQFRALLSAAGFGLRRVVPTAGFLVVLEAAPV